MPETEGKTYTLQETLAAIGLSFFSDGVYAQVDESFLENPVITFAHIPIAKTEIVSINGLIQRNSYLIQGTQITFLPEASLVLGDKIYVAYQWS